MLVLARKSNETIHIGDRITVKVISIRNGQVKLGIDAPKDLRVTRDDHHPGTTTLPLSELEGVVAPVESVQAATPHHVAE